MKRPFLLFAIVAVMACGPTIGDPCTTGQDCLGQVCLNNDSVPGGYCTLSCQGSASQCPTGSECISDGISHGTNGCYRTCHTSLDCRSGYQCQVVHGSDSGVCIGPKGL